MNLDDAMREAANDVHDSFDGTPAPAFSPSEGMALGPRLVAVAAVVIFGVAGWLVLRPDRRDATAIETPVAAESTTTVPEPVPTNVGPNTEGLVVDRLPRPLSPMTQPGEVPSVEPDFGTSIRRLSAGQPGEVTTPVYSGTQAFNADGSLLLLYRTGADRVEHIVVDPVTGDEVASLVLDAGDIEDVAWDATDPAVLRYVRSGTNELIAHDVMRGDRSIEAVFDGCDTVDLGETSGSTSSGTALLGWLCHRDDGGTELVAYDTVGHDELGRRVVADGRDAPVAMASGSGFVVIAPDHVEVFDTRLEPTGAERIEFEASNVSLAVDARGRDVLVATSFGEPAVGTVVVVDLMSGAISVVAGPDAGYPYPPSGTAMSASIGGAGLVAVATHPPPPLDDTLAGEVLLVDLVGDAGPVVYRLAHHRMSDSDEPWNQPQVAVSPDGTLVAFSSDWGGATIDTYLIDLR